MNISDLDKYKAVPVAKDYPADRRTFYAPIDDVHGVIMAVLRSTQHSMILSMFGFTDVEAAAVVDELLENPAIYCQVTLDKTQYFGHTESEVLKVLRDDLASNSVAIGTSEHGEIIHRKMLIADDFVVMGSTNWSLNGEQRQDNELTVIQSAVVAAEARHVLDLSHSKALTDKAKLLAEGKIEVE